MWCHLGSARIGPDSILVPSSLDTVISMDEETMEAASSQHLCVCVGKGFNITQYRLLF